MSVSVIQDDEFATPWFIIIDGEADAVVRFALDAVDVEMRNAVHLDGTAKMQQRNLDVC